MILGVPFESTILKLSEGELLGSYMRSEFASEADPETGLSAKAIGDAYRNMPEFSRYPI